ncbi:unnamed protein product [Amoebophrya sp. A25]|nr:unnamed protein product [Amoebophrya sp. A25]|eukprot:GSA25T00002058001.1
MADGKHNKWPGRRAARQRIDWSVQNVDLVPSDLTRRRPALVSEIEFSMLKLHLKDDGAFVLTQLCEWDLVGQVIEFSDIANTYYREYLFRSAGNEHHHHHGGRGENKAYLQEHPAVAIWEAMVRKGPTLRCPDVLFRGQGLWSLLGYAVACGRGRVVRTLLRAGATPFMFRESLFRFELFDRNDGVESDEDDADQEVIDRSRSRPCEYSSYDRLGWPADLDVRSFRSPHDDWCRMGPAEQGDGQLPVADGYGSDFAELTGHFMREYVHPGYAAYILERLFAMTVPAGEHGTPRESAGKTNKEMSSRARFLFHGPRCGCLFSEPDFWGSFCRWDSRMATRFRCPSCGCELGDHRNESSTTRKEMGFGDADTDSTASTSERTTLPGKERPDLCQHDERSTAEDLSEFLPSRERFELLPEDRCCSAKQNDNTRVRKAGPGATSDETRYGRVTLTLREAKSLDIGYTQQERMMRVGRAIETDDLTRLSCLCEAGIDLSRPANEYGQPALEVAASSGTGSAVVNFILSGLKTMLLGCESSTSGAVACERGRERFIAHVRYAQQLAWARGHTKTACLIGKALELADSQTGQGIGICVSAPSTGSPRRLNMVCASAAFRRWRAVACDVTSPRQQVTHLQLPQSLLPGDRERAAPAFYVDGAFSELFLEELDRCYYTMYERTKRKIESQTALQLDQDDDAVVNEKPGGGEQQEQNEETSTLTSCQPEVNACARPAPEEPNASTKQGETNGKIKGRRSNKRLAKLNGSRCRKSTEPLREYFNDPLERVRTALRLAVSRIIASSPSSSSASEFDPELGSARPDNVSSDVWVYPQMRYLHYDQAEKAAAAHTDLSRTVDIGINFPDASGLTGRHGKITSTHTFILYLTSLDESPVSETAIKEMAATPGSTRMLSSLAPTADVLAEVVPRRGRLLLFPHNFPHEGFPVAEQEKLLLRGEAVILRGKTC